MRLFAPAIVLIFGLISGRAALGQNTPRPSIPYGIQSILDGLDLPTSRITAFAQTPDGYLWIGTSFGLVRWDGQESRLFNVETAPEMKVDRIESLGVDGSGALWVGTLGGGRLQREGTLLRLSNGRMTRVDPDTGLAAGAAFRILWKDKNSDLWVTSGGRLAVLSGGQWRSFGMEAGFDGSQIRFMARDSNQRLWVATEKGLGWFEAERWKQFQNGGAPMNGIACGAADSAGRFWLGTPRGLLRFDPLSDQILFFESKAGYPNGPVSSLWTDHFGPADGAVRGYPRDALYKIGGMTHEGALLKLLCSLRSRSRPFSF